MTTGVLTFAFFYFEQTAIKPEAAFELGTEHP
jgi:hypothetical protein